MADEKPNRRIHGSGPRGEAQVPHSPLYQGRFGRMFRELRGAHDPTDAETGDLLRLLAAGMREPDVEPDDDAGKQDHWAKQADPEKADDGLNNTCLPAGYTYFGQFVDHDITFDPTSSLQRANDPNALKNFRTPRFDLDSVYGRGPADSPYQYESHGDFAGIRFLIGANPSDNADWRADGDPEETYEPTDLPRSQRGEARALIGDPRNDENTIVSQLQLAMLRVHNAFVRKLSSEGWSATHALFEEAQRLTRWHYQWAVVNDFVVRLAGRDVVDEILGVASWPYKAPRSAKGKQGGCDVGAFDIEPGRLNDGLRFFRWKHQPYMPVEFSVAAYRFGHTLIRPAYELNDQTGFIPIFAPGQPGQFGDLRGFRRLPIDWSIDWSRFFDGGDGADHVQFSRRIDPLLAPGLMHLPGLDPASLAERNLRRGAALGLPSGQDLSRFMGLDPGTVAGPGGGDMADLTDHLAGLDLVADLHQDVDAGRQGEMAERFGQSTPLWYYLLAEAEGASEGLALGPVGGRVVAEVLCGLLIGDPFSYVQQDPTWEPAGAVLGVQIDAGMTVGTLMDIAAAERAQEQG